MALTDVLAVEGVDGTELFAVDASGNTQIAGTMTVDGASTLTGATSFTGRVTTTDGVTSGTARTVGGLAYASVAASAAVTNTTTETDFDETYSIPANTLKAGTVVHIRTQGIATATNSTDTLTVILYFGATAIVTTAAVDVANGDIWTADAYITVRTAGASGTFVANASYQDPDAAGTAPKWTSTASTAIDTTAAVVVKASATWSVASTANSCRQDFLTVEIT